MNRRDILKFASILPFGPAFNFGLDKNGEPIKDEVSEPSPCPKKEIPFRTYYRLENELIGKHRLYQFTMPSYHIENLSVTTLDGVGYFYPGKPSWGDLHTKIFYEDSKDENLKKINEYFFHIFKVDTTLGRSNFELIDLDIKICKRDGVETDITFKKAWPVNVSWEDMDRPKHWENLPAYCLDIQWKFTNLVHHLPRT